MTKKEMVLEKKDYINQELTRGTTLNELYDNVCKSDDNFKKEIQSAYFKTIVSNEFREHFGYRTSKFSQYKEEIIEMFKNGLTKYRIWRILAQKYPKIVSNKSNVAIYKYFSTLKELR